MRRCRQHRQFARIEHAMKAKTYRIPSPSILQEHVPEL